MGPMPRGMLCVIGGLAALTILLLVLLAAVWTADAAPPSCRGNGRNACPTPTPTVIVQEPICEVLQGRIRYDAGSDWVEVWDAAACW